MATRKFFIILALLFIGLGYGARQNKLFAVTCAPTDGSPTFTLNIGGGSCQFASSMPGIDAGTGTVNTADLVVSNGTLTVAAGTEIHLGKITVGSLGIVSNVGTTCVGCALYYTDADVDGYAADPATTPVSLTGGAGKKRRSELSSTTVWDCNDASYSLTNTCCVVATYYQDADGDGKGNPAVSQSICPTAGWVGDNTDCNDGSNLVWVSHAQCYANMDQDPETAGLQANTTCLNTGDCSTATKASASTNGAAVSTYTAGQLANAAAGGNADCNDGNSSYYHGNGNWYSDTGDHNCSGGVEYQYGSFNCTNCTAASGHPGKYQETDGMVNSACGATDWLYVSLHWGCSEGTICPSQGNTQVTQGCH